MKVSFIGKFSDINPDEGRIKIVKEIKSHLENNGFEVGYNLKKADIYHAHSSGVYDSILLSKIKRQEKKVCFYSLYSSCHCLIKDYFLNYYEQWALNGYMDPMHFILASSSILPFSWRNKHFRKLDKVIVPSLSLKKQLYKNTDVIHLGIDINRFKKITEKTGKEIGFLGHSSSFKGIMDYVEVSKKITDMNFSLYLTHVSERVKKKIKKLNPNLRLYGNTKNIEGVYNKLDIVVLPYRSSLSAITNPLVLLEAMASECAVITTDIPYIKEIVKNSGIIVPPYSPNKLGEAIDRLRDKKLRETLGKKAREIIMKAYQKKDMLNNYLRLYQSI